MGWHWLINVNFRYVSFSYSICILYCVLTTQNLVSFSHHIFQPLYPLHPTTPTFFSPLVTTIALSVNFLFCFAPIAFYVPHEWNYMVLALFWFISLSTILSRSIHVVINSNILPFSWPSSIPLDNVPHLLYPVKQHLGCFHVSTIVNNAAMDTGVHIYPCSRIGLVLFPWFQSLWSFVHYFFSSASLLFCVLV